MASSSLSVLDCWVYDVFVSFSGVDVRVTFLSHLIKELDMKLIKSFKDKKIERGRWLHPELKLAINTSKIALVVFSENYASSNWCLNELLEIDKCSEEFGQIVIPVFYRLDPSHVRHQTGDFGKIFHKTCQNKTEKMKTRLTKALTNIANILGYHSVTWGNEAKMIEKITSNVLGKLFFTSSKDSDEFLGMENHIKKLILLLNFKSTKVMMVGVSGSSGIGKTTIARILLNRISRYFQRSVFIDRAFVSKSMGIYSSSNPDDYNMKLRLQEKFLSKILGEKHIQISHLGAVKERLKNHNVLIIIDDLENQFVLDTLAGHISWFGRGSRIILITKQKDLLKDHGIDDIYEVHPPSDALALKMFCRFAFKQDYPPDGFKELASETVLRAGNLPLGLKLLGSYLRGRGEHVWVDMLLMFRDGQHGKIEEIVKFCYNGLSNKNDKAIFRHIAFLKGEHISDIKLLLADSDLDVDNGLKNLVDKSLIHERLNTVEMEMHPLLQEVGEEIIHTQPNKPEEREFLVDSKDIRDVLEDNTGTKKILGISLDADNTKELTLSEEAFKGMHNLRYLNVSSKILNLLEDLEDFPLEYLPRSLIFLSWFGYPHRCMPKYFEPEKLVKLQMQSSKLEKMWDGVRSLPALKTIYLGGSKNLKEIPDLSMAPKLERLDLVACLSLVELPSSIQNLNNLKMLDMSSCTKLEILPDNINLKALDRLNLSGCSKLSSFPNISTNISFLNIDRTGIEEVPWWIENFTKLKLLNMQGCNKLEYVSLNISKLKDLETVDFSNCLALNEASLNDSLSVMATEDIHSKVLVPVGVSSSLPIDYLPRVEFNFLNCFNLDQEALLRQQPVFKKLLLSGEEVPSYFTHRTTSTSLSNIPLLETSLSSSIFRFMACAAIDCGSTSMSNFSFLIEVYCQFIDIFGNHFGSAYWPRYFSTASVGSHLVVFNCCLRLNEDYAYLAKRNYDHVDIQFRLVDDYSLFKLKGCGVRLFENCTLSLDSIAQVSEETERRKKRISRECEGTQPKKLLTSSEAKPSTEHMYVIE